MKIKAIQKHAWTMIELIIAIAIVLVISITLVSIVKPNTQKARVFMYTTIRNLTKGHIAIMEKYNNDPVRSEDVLYRLPEDDTAGKDSYCLEMADVFATKGSVDCSKTASNATTNITLENGVELRGMASAEIVRNDLDYTFKNIIVDIDGFAKGVNKIWVDQFPLRIYGGTKLNGNIQPVNCADDSVYNTSDTKVTLPEGQKSPYCGSKAVNFTNDNSLITYDVLNLLDTGNGTDSAGYTMASNLSAMKADCLAYGGTGVYSGAQCSAAGYRILAKCATGDVCETCTGFTPSTCPLDSSGVATTTTEACLAANELNGTCAVYLHKPSSGASMMLEPLIGNLDDDEGNISGNQPKIDWCKGDKLMKIGNLCVTKFNMGDEGLDIPASAGVTMVSATTDGSQSCTPSENHPCCWNAVSANTANSCNADNGGYSGCTRTVCDWYAANKICSNYSVMGHSFRLATSSELSSIFINQNSINQGASGLQMCDTYTGYGSAQCNIVFRSYGAYNNRCYSTYVWGETYSSTIAHDRYLVQGNWLQNTNNKSHAFSVRCVADLD